MDKKESYGVSEIKDTIQAVHTLFSGLAEAKKDGKVSLFEKYVVGKNVFKAAMKVDPELLIEQFKDLKVDELHELLRWAIDNYDIQSLDELETFITIISKLVNNGTTKG